MRPNTSLWINPKEWLQVFFCLFGKSSDNASRKIALNHIRYWKSRAELPLAVELTFSFFDITLHDPLIEYTKFFDDKELYEMDFGDTSRHTSETCKSTIYPPFSDSHLAMLYGMSIVRLVNGFVDSQQTKIYAQPITRLAEKVNIPRWFVELRHEVTHDKLPHLDSLRLAASEAIRWLYDFYWRPQYDQWTNIKSQMNTLLDAYVSFVPKCQDHQLLQQMIDSFLNIFESLENSFCMQRMWLCMLIEKVRADSTPLKPYWMWIEALSINDMFIIHYASVLFSNNLAPSKVFWDILDKLLDHYLVSNNSISSLIIDAFVSECKRHPIHPYATKYLNKIKRLGKMIGKLKDNDRKETKDKSEDMIFHVVNWTPCPLGHLPDQWNSESLLQ